MSGERQDPEQVIRDWLADSAPDRAPASLRETLEDVTTRPAGNSREQLGARLPRLRLAGGIAAALAILAVVSSSVYIHATSNVAGPSAAESASLATPVGPTATASVGSEKQLVGDWHLVDTQMVDDQPGAFSQSMVTRVVGLSSGGFAAFVFDQAHDETVVYGSSDGTTWTSVGVLPTKHATVTSVTDKSGTVVAAGYAYDNAADTAVAIAWVSSDLRTWHASVLPASINVGVDMVAAGPGGFLAYGHDLTQQSPGNATPSLLFWTSADGTTWRTVAGTGYPNAWPYHLYTNADGYVAITNISGRIQSWTSVDGAAWIQSWTSPTDSASYYSIGGPDMTTPDGSRVMFGSATNFSTNSVKWTSRDLVRWTMSPAQITPIGTDIGQAASIPGGLVSASWCDYGQATAAFCLITSSDGRAWQQVPVTSTLARVADSGMSSWGIVSDGAHVVVVLHDNGDGIHFLVGTTLR
ncbi:MAG TPA: hypothetical protein VF337_04110 [Candidatus Limnocylindrales bacterium]